MGIEQGTSYSVRSQYFRTVTVSGSGATRRDDFTAEWSGSYTDGTTDGSVDRAVAPTSASLTGTQDFDLNSYTGASGAEAMAEVVLIWVYNSGAVNLEVKPHATNGWTNGIPGTQVLTPGMVWGWAVENIGRAVSGANKVIQFNVPTGTGAYQAVIKGRSV